MDDCLDDVFPVHGSLRLGLVLASLLDFLGADERGRTLEGHALNHLLQTLVGGGVGGDFRLEQHTAAADVLAGVEVLHGVGSARADANLESSEAVYVDALGCLQGVGDHLDHLNENGVGVTLLGGGVALNKLGDVHQADGLGVDGLGVPLLVALGHLLVVVLYKFVKV